MSTLKARYDPDRARKLLRSSFPDARDVTPLTGGEASQAFAFISGDRSLVLRVNHSRSYFRDFWASEIFAGTPVPVPSVLASGKEGCYFWAVSERVAGVPLRSLPGETVAALRTPLLHMLAHIHATPLPPGSGYGYLGDDGIAPALSWRDFIEGEGKFHGFIDWDRVVREAEPRISALIRDAWEAGDRLVPYCPEERALNHGDFNLDNILGNGERITGVVDWGCIIGDPLWDIAWMEFWAPKMAFAEAWLQLWPVEHGEQRLMCYRLRMAAHALGFFLQTGRPDLANDFSGRVKAVLNAAQEEFRN
jgi:hygromycin-B 4-O-kinase